MIFLTAHRTWFSLKVQSKIVSKMCITSFVYNVSSSQGFDTILVEKMENFWKTLFGLQKLFLKPTESDQIKSEVVSSQVGDFSTADKSVDLILETSMGWFFLARCWQVLCGMLASSKSIRRTKSCLPQSSGSNKIIWTIARVTRDSWIYA